MHGRWRIDRLHTACKPRSQAGQRTGLVSQGDMDTRECVAAQLCIDRWGKVHGARMQGNSPAVQLEQLLAAWPLNVPGGHKPEQASVGIATVAPN
jgi:hypothetical protein